MYGMPDQTNSDSAFIRRMVQSMWFMRLIACSSCWKARLPQSFALRWWKKITRRCCLPLAIASHLRLKFVTPKDDPPMGGLRAGKIITSKAVITYAILRKQS